MERDRSYRRHHRQRVVAKAKNSNIVRWIAEDSEHLNLRANYFADNLKKCGCEMCRNPRRAKNENKNYLRTRQEKLADISYKEQQMEQLELALISEEETDKQVCSVCGVVHVVPETHQVNHCTVEVTHHYGSPKDGDQETYSVCVDCVSKLFGKLKPINVTNYMEDWLEHRKANNQEG